ncbi:MAG: hypothetical protein J0H74_04145 [Chitinophagaceae bacterium]|nr:hypothetical protein [Chitinophagaceae bacterium]
MNYILNRDTIVTRIQKELIGPGSDIFLCKNDFSDEIIEGKPLQRYFSGILYPKQKVSDGSENGLESYSQDLEEGTENHQSDLKPSNATDENRQEDDEQQEGDDASDSSTTLPPQVINANGFFPAHFGLSFCVKRECKELNLTISFGIYKKAKFNEIILPYSGDDTYLLNKFGFSQFVEFDAETKGLKQTRELRRKEKNPETGIYQKTADYEYFEECRKEFRKEFPNHPLYKHLTKLFFKDKYKRYDNKIQLSVKITDILNSENCHVELVLSKQPGANDINWHKDNKDNLVLHLKLYSNYPNRYYIKAILENKYAYRKDQFSFSKEKLNLLSLFQTEIKIHSDCLKPFKDYHADTYKSDEDKMLDYLFREKLAFGIGHNASCQWEDLETTNWIKTTFIPHYDVRSQSTQTEKIDGTILRIKALSSFNNNKHEIIENLQKIADAYSYWIEEQEVAAKGHALAFENIEKCREIHRRITRGIQLIYEDAGEHVLRSFQLANTAIYLQMFQTEKHFNKRRDGYEVYERVEELQLPFDHYANATFPLSAEGKIREPEWRPFQLAFILQCIPSIVEENSDERKLVDLLYFPTGGGKTEAYLAVSAFVVFWRRLKYKDQYDGVNIIIRYTLRLLSAQQFERATKLILACEFIRQNNKDLGEDKISIGFWIGDKTIPNSIEKASKKLQKIQDKLNNKSLDGKYAINPFQVTNCQWCNSKIISRINSNDPNYLIGHRISNHLQSYCLNEKCNFCASKGGLPIVLIDDDIYKKPPTVLFATVDKFASLAWKEEATKLFNYKLNRKPELIIQDELHLLNGPLGSLVGLFENVILSLCTTSEQTPKIIASTATTKNVVSQIKGLYGRDTRIFPQNATTSDDTFFSKTLPESKRRYIGILPTGKTTVMTNLQLLASLLFARLEIWEQSKNKAEVDQYWTLLSYFKSLKELGRFSNKITAELKPEVQQLQVRNLKNQDPYPYNYWKLSSQNIELTARIPNEKIKRNLDKLEISFTGDLSEYKVLDLVLATNMISVGLDVNRLGIMVINGMPPNTAEYIQASSRVARKNEGLVFTVFDPFNTRDLSYFEDFVQFHKTFYKQVEPLSVTPFAENALDKMLFTVMVAYFRHKLDDGKYASNDKPGIIKDDNIQERLKTDFADLFKKHPFINGDFSNILVKIESLLTAWKYRTEANKNLKFFWQDHPKDSLLKPMEDRKDDDILIALNSMRNVDPNTEITIKQY